jgi:hypothetical protein
MSAAPAHFAYRFCHAARTGIELSRSSVYVTLDRLDRKGCSGTL